MSAIETQPQNARRKTEGRQPDYVVRAKTGPGGKEWSTVGSAWNRDMGEGISVKLNAIPIGEHWKGVLKLLPPYADDDVNDSE
ncbi:MAG: hypothetical protein AB7F96_03395 [Beijerinckiaceae bacterium]